LLLSQLDHNQQLLKKCNMKKKKHTCANCQSLINAETSPGRSKCALGYKMEWVEKDQQYVPVHQCIKTLEKIKGKSSDIP